MSVLARHPDAALIRSLPGMGVTLTAELLAAARGLARFPDGNKLAAAAGLAPVLKQSGKVRDLRRDLWAVFGVHSRFYPEPGGRFFIRQESGKRDRASYGIVP